VLPFYCDLLGFRVVHDAEALFKRLTDAGVNILSGMTSYQAARTTGTTYAFTVADPTGVRITFAQLAGPVPE
jgi:hypothetical protein